MTLTNALLADFEGTGFPNQFFLTQEWSAFGGADHIADSGRLTSSRPWRAARHLTIDRHSAVIRKQLDRVVQAAHRIFADAFQIEIALDEVRERTGQQHRSPQLFGEGFETRGHVDGRTDDREVEPGA